jgi:predicted SAM-dependent methyltransferase
MPARMTLALLQKRSRQAVRLGTHYTLKGIRRSNLLWNLLETASFRAYRAELAHDDLRLHLGCGGQLLPGWVNVDVGLMRGMLTARLPGAFRRFASSSARYIYASHLVEHLAYPTEAGAFVRECHRILQPGGVLRVLVPDIEQIIRAYVADDALFFQLQAAIHPPDCTTKLDHLMFALQQRGQHRYGYDFETMAKLLKLGGFSQITKSGRNASAFPALNIDYHDRDYHDRTGIPFSGTLSLYVDAIK